MAKKKAVDQSIVELKKAIESKKIIIGTERTLKALKKDDVASVYVTKNCPKNIRNKIEHYSKLIKFRVVSLEYPNDELGTLCKKPFAISVAAIRK